MCARGTAIVCALVVAMSARGAAQSCGPRAPRVNKPGFRASATITYTVAPSASGRPFPDEMVACVERAFDAWTAANAHSLLGVQFVPGPDGIVVRYDDVRRLLPRDVAGAWLNGRRAPDGALESAEILLSPYSAVLDSCDGVTKTVLHELGHLHGLADHGGGNGTSVMNGLRRKNDRGNAIPLTPTACDAATAAVASSLVDEVRLAQGATSSIVPGPTTPRVPPPPSVRIRRPTP